ncbi:MAG TPA: hypothetical protein VMV87_12125 [Burkholderiales bacterium]|nr:hypothetical protein [Burkholderiales bacterium]
MRLFMQAAADPLAWWPEVVARLAAPAAAVPVVEERGGMHQETRAVPARRPAAARVAQAGIVAVTEVRAVSPEAVVARLARRTTPIEAVVTARQAR